MRNLTEVLAARAAKKVPMKHERNRIAFLACIEEIKEVLEGGWTIKDIWEALREEGRISYGYEVFRGYVKRMIPAQPAKPATLEKSVETTRSDSGGEGPPERLSAKDPAATLSSAGENAVNKGAGTKIAESEGIPTFKWNPNPNPEELF